MPTSGVSGWLSTRLAYYRYTLPSKGLELDGFELFELAAGTLQTFTRLSVSESGARFGIVKCVGEYQDRVCWSGVVSGKCDARCLAASIDSAVHVAANATPADGGAAAASFRS